MTSFVSALDGKALNTFGHGQYQGLTRDHYVEVDLGDDAPKSGPLYLIAHGSIHDTESSLNVAITQGERWKAQALESRGAGRKRWLGRGATKPRFSRGTKENSSVQSYGCFSARHAAARADANQPGDLLGPDRVGRGSARCSGEDGRAESELDGPALSRLFGHQSDPTPARLHPRCPITISFRQRKQSWRDLIGYYTRYGDVTEL